jgi:hypothetical protein
MLYNSLQLQTNQRLLSLYLPLDSLKLNTAILILSKSEIVFRMKKNFYSQLLKLILEPIQSFSIDRF